MRLKKSGCQPALAWQDIYFSVYILFEAQRELHLVQPESKSAHRGFLFQVSTLFCLCQNCTANDVEYNAYVFLSPAVPASASHSVNILTLIQKPSGVQATTPLISKGRERFILGYKRIARGKTEKYSVYRRLSIQLYFHSKKIYYFLTVC